MRKTILRSPSQTRNQQRLAQLWTLAVIVVSVAAAPAVPALTFDERVDAQEAIERFYHSQRIGSRKSFEEAVSRTVLENISRSPAISNSSLQRR